MINDTILTDDCISSFVDNGFLRFKNAFPRDVAYECRKYLENVLNDDGIRISDQKTWVIRKGLSTTYTRNDGYPWSGVFTDKLKYGIDKLCGKGVWDESSLGCGWWVISFPKMLPQPWRVDGHWHVDGSWHKHYPFSKEVGLVVVMLFSDVLKEGGGTAVVKGSHKNITRILLDAGLKGLTNVEIADIALSNCWREDDVLELTGEAGDVFFLHPHLLHARSTNQGTNGIDSIRYMCHPSIILKEHMNFNIPVEEMTPVMRSMISNADDIDSDGNPISYLRELQYITPEAVVKFQTKKSNKRKKSLQDINESYRRLCQEQQDSNDENYSDLFNPSPLTNEVEVQVELQPDIELYQIMGFSNFSSDKV